MSELPAIAGIPRSGRVTLEQRLFEVSPLGTLGTSVAIFAVLFASFEGLAILTHYSFYDQLSFNANQGTWPAAILSLLAAVALGMQRYVRLKDMDEWPALMRLVPCDPDTFAINSPSAARRIARAGFIGLAAGLGAAFAAVPPGVLGQHLPVFIWFAVVMAFLGALFARGTAMTRIAAAVFAERVDRELRVDLLRVDELSLIGRSAGRTALVWISVAAVICLFFVGGNVPSLVIATVVLSAGMAFWIFFRSLERVHQRIRQAKKAELDRLRHAIAEQRERLLGDHTAAARLHGLLAYETRIEHVHEWPFDQLTLLRMASYILIPASPAIGQIAMKYFVHFSG